MQSTSNNLQVIVSTLHRNVKLQIAISIAFFLLVAAFVFTSFSGFNGLFILVSASVIGAYMAMNIGANDVANNVGPAVGSKAITLIGAICIAFIFEAAGALIAGGDVVSTIKKGIINPSTLNNSESFVWLMFSALLAAALWLHLATFFRAPVSTTHSIVGGVLGAGIVAGGLQVANWDKMSYIAASWVISPFLGGLIAASIQFVIKKRIFFIDDKLAAAKRILPSLLAVMAWSFATYLVLKGLKKLWAFSFLEASLIGCFIGFTVFIVSKKYINTRSVTLQNTRTDVNRLFSLPLICAAALLSFAHGANDVANAVGPLAAIHDSLQNQVISTKASIPFWIMLIGALGLALGLFLYGPKLIKTVGSEITALDQSRAFSVALAAAITVIIASQLGLPVSSTHITLGALFGIGFLRERLKRLYASRLEIFTLQNKDPQKSASVNNLLDKFEDASVDELQEKLIENGLSDSLFKGEQLTVANLDTLSDKKRYKQILVDRFAFTKIIAAWLLTVPISAGLAGGLYLLVS